MKKILAYALAIVVAASAVAGCSGFEKDIPLRRVTLMYVAGFSNLSNELGKDIDDMCAGSIPTLRSGDVLLVYSHLAQGRALSIKTKPVLFRAYRDEKGAFRRDTLKTYPEETVSSTAESLRSVLNEVKTMFPAPHYALTVSSHGKGWIPVGYKEDYSDYIFGEESVRDTREFCIEQVDGSGINMEDLSVAIPMKLDYIIMDSCLMGCVETAYELKDKCDYIVFSPMEVLVDGMAYSTMASRITNVSKPDLVRVASDYFEQYNSRSTYYRSATVTLVDCSGLDHLAEVCKSLVAAHREDIAGCSHDSVQKYFYNSFHWFFDLRDIFAQSEADQEELAALDAALKATVVYEAHTNPCFGVEMERVCGLSMYLPYDNLTELNDYYRTLSWNKAISLIQ